MKCHIFLFVRFVCSVIIATLSLPSLGVDITFDGGAGQVGGSCALVENGSSKILVDCGTFYGEEAGPESKKEKGDFSFDPKKIDALLVTHAHADHTGRIPQLVRAGFKGTIYMTEPTLKLLEEALKSQAFYDDSYERDWLWSKNSNWFGWLFPKKNEKITVHWRSDCKKKGEKLSQMHGRYSELSRKLVDCKGCKECSRLDVKDCLRNVKTINFDEKFPLGGFTIVFRPVEHLPGSAAIYFRGGGTSFLFSGDLGTFRSRTANPVPVSSKVDAVFIESTYGDKPGKNEKETEQEYERFAKVVKGALDQGKLVWIPAFAMDRTQRVMLELVRCGANPTAFYSFSSSGNAMTKYYLENPQLFPKEATKWWTKLSDLYQKKEKWFDPKKSSRASVVLLTTSGMMDHGSSYGLLDKLLPDSNVVLCLVGYQSPGTPGAQLKAGAKTIELKDGKKVDVRATVESFDCFSGHGDARENDKWLGENVHSKIYLIHGDPDALEKRKVGLEERFGSNVEIVERNKKYHLGSAVK
jgi:metallo-beta-lactamase family protein